MPRPTKANGGFWGYENLDKMSRSRGGIEGKHNCLTPRFRLWCIAEPGMDSTFLKLPILNKASYFEAGLVTPFNPATKG